MTLKQFSIICWLFCALPVLLHAQHYNMSGREWSSKRTGTDFKSCFATGTAVNQCDTIICQTDFFNTPSALGNFQIKEVRNFVKFYIDHSEDSIFAPFTYQVVFNIKGYKTANSNVPSNSFTDTLTISYDPDSINSYQDINIRSYYGFFRTEVQVLSLYDMTQTYAAMKSGASTIPAPASLLNSSSNVSAMKTNWIFEVGMVIQKHDLVISGGTPASVYSSSMSGISPVPTSNLLSNSNTLRISWPISTTENPNPAMYELEWVYADDYAISMDNGVMTLADKAASYDFRGNSSRIITNKTYFDIPLIYKRGYLAYRTRLLRPDTSSYLTTLYGPWSNQTDSAVIPYSGSGYYKIATPHISDIVNWNFETSYAEEGKSKNVLGYFDGLLKNRQTLTRFSSRPNELIGAEQYYNYEGQSELQTLPVPVNNQSNLSFISGFAKSSITNATYKAADFDAYNKQGKAPPPLAPVSSNSLAAAYYAHANPLLGTGGNNYLKAVPDAEGYPLIQTKHTPDDPGRIDLQGGAGKELQINGGHASKYYYVKPTQMELDKYLGANTGMLENYQKTITRDPNKELSFSITNRAGQPVMTGLMGMPDTSNGAPLMSVDSVTISMSSFDSANSTSNIYTATKPLWTGNGYLHSLNFYRETGGGMIGCYGALAPISTCSDSNYDYVMHIPLRYAVDNQGEQDSALVHLFDTTIVPNYNNTYVTKGSVWSGTSFGWLQVDMSKLLPGENNISFYTYFNPEDVDSAVRAYISIKQQTHSSCIKTESDFFNLAYKELPIDCETEVSNSSGNGTAGGDYDISTSACVQMQAIMQMQLRPQGIYAAYVRKGRANSILVGNGRSMYAITGWKALPNSGQNTCNAATQQKDTARFIASVYPTLQNGLTYPSGTGIDLNDTVDFLLKYFKPTYAFQNAMQNSSVSSLNTTINGKAVTITPDSSGDNLLDVIDNNILAQLLFFHPEYCDMFARYCDQSHYTEELEAIPNYTQAQLVGRSTLSDLIGSDPFGATYYSQYQNTDALKRLKFMVVNGGVFVGEREMDIDYFAYVKAICDESSNADDCLANYIPNATGSPVTAPSNLSTLIAALSQSTREIYYQQLKEAYIANRGRKIESFRYSPLPSCPRYSWVDDSQKVFPEYLDASDIPKFTKGSPTYNQIVSGNLTNNIGSALNGVNGIGGASNDLEEYAQSIVRQLLNCRTINNGSYDATLFTNIYDDIIAHMQSCITLDRDRRWKGGVTPNALKGILQNRGVALNDLCNPYLVSYQQSAKSLGLPCDPTTSGTIHVNIDTNLQAYDTALLDYTTIYAPSYTEIYGSGIVNAFFTESKYALFYLTFPNYWGLYYPPTDTIDVYLDPNKKFDAWIAATTGVDIWNGNPVSFVRSLSVPGMSGGGLSMVYKFETWMHGAHNVSMTYTINSDAIGNFDWKRHAHGPHWPTSTYHSFPQPLGPPGPGPIPLDTSYTASTYPFFVSPHYKRAGGSIAVLILAYRQQSKKLDARFYVFKNAKSTTRGNRPFHLHACQ